MRSFIHGLPKAELHSHLAGSIRPSTLRELIPDGVSLLSILENAQKRTLSQCFQIFDVIHKTVNTSIILERIVKEMVQDNSSDGVVYLEIRSTPRKLIDFSFEEGEKQTWTIEIEPGNTVELDASAGYEPVDAALNNYVESVAHAVYSASKTSPIVVRLILSVNRTSSLASIERIVTLACAWKNASKSKIVVGLDVSGDPTRGDMTPILALLKEKAAGKIPVCIHAGETMNVAETEAILDYRPERLGHCCVLSEATRRRMLDARIPLELCPTSNLLTLHLPSFAFHPQCDFWLDSNYPVAICTDDSGVFNVTLTDELLLVAETRQMSKEQVTALCLEAFNFPFCDDETKGRIKTEAARRALRLLEEDATELE